VIVGADLLVTGAVHGGAGIEAFLDHRLQKSGRHWAWSLRTGAEYEWIPGWVRLRGGAYWEPGRFEGVAGRAHATLGFDLRFFAFGFLGDRYRLRLSFAADGAVRYANVPPRSASGTDPQCDNRHHWQSVTAPTGVLAIVRDSRMTYR
jgi:hypothetical protein